MSYLIKPEQDRPSHVHDECRAATAMLFGSGPAGDHDG